MKPQVVVSLFLILIPTIAFAGTVSQTDWSGGDGVPGPVTDLAETFDTESQMNWSGVSGEITLGKGSLNPVVKHTVGIEFMNVVSAHAADVNGDGYMDVLGASGADATIAWWENEDGSGTSWTEHIVDDTFGGAYCVYAEDVNGDGFMDVLGVCRYDDEITWWENVDGSGTSWIEHLVTDEIDYPLCVYAADINNDGYMDILSAVMEDDEMTWWENTDGTGTNLVEHTIDGQYDGAHSISAADMDDDGDLDVVGAARNDNEITWWENVDGLGTSWTRHIAGDNFSGAFSAVAADVNGDGFMDITGVASHVDEVAWWANEDGTGLVWTKHVIDSNFDGANLVYAADLDSDGDIDVMSAAYYGDLISWWENADGMGTSWTEHIIDNDSWHPRSVYAADVNDDGNMDVVASSFFDHDVSWYDIVQYSSEGSIESSIFDTQDYPDWQTLDWTGSSPTGTTITFQVRASDDFASMGDWSADITTPGSLSGMIDEGDSFFQYRTIFTSSSSTLTPVIEDVTVTWNPTGIEQQDNAYHEVGILSNPSIGSAILTFSLPFAASADLVVYDVTGRVVFSLSGEYQSGTHQVKLNDLTSGTYLSRMTSGDLTSALQFVIVK